MQHADAIRSMASEKYLLDELTPELREEFEEHFFSCPDCALDIRVSAAFLEHSKVALSAPTLPEQVARAQPSRQRDWLWWLRPAIALPVMALLIVVGYQNLVTFPKTKNELADLRLPQVLPSASLVSARSDRVPVVAIHPNQSFLLFVDVPTEGRFPSYTCELYSPAGALVWSLPVSAEAAKDTLALHVPSGQQTPGRYTLAVSGVDAGRNHTSVARYTFDLQPQQ